MDKKRLPTGKGIAVGKSIEEIIVSRALNDVPDTIFPQIGKNRHQGGGGRTKGRGNFLSKSASGPILLDQSSDPHVGIQGGVSEVLAKYCQSLQLKLEEMQSKLDNSEAIQEVMKADIKRLGGSTRHYAERARGLSSSSNAADLLHSQQGRASSPQRRDSVASNHSGVVSLESRRGSAGHAVTFNLGAHQSHSENQQKQKQIRSMVGGMDSKMVQLKQLFSHVDPLDERARAATRIAGVIRGFISRRRFSIFSDALMKWKWGRCMAFVTVVHHMTKNVSRIEKGIHRLKMRRDTILSRTVLTKWHQVVKNALPLRKRIHQQAEEKMLIKQFKMKLQVFLAFREGCIGNGSRKQARRARRLLIDEKRNEIIEENYRITGLRLLAPEDQVMRLVHRQVLADAKVSSRMRTMRRVFDRIGSVYRDMQLKTKQAKRYMFRRYAGRVFSAWSNWLFLVSVGLDRKRWRAPGKYEIKYNQKQVDNFSRLRCLRLAYTGWKRYAKVSATVNLKYTFKITAMIRSYLVAWKELCQRNKMLIRTSVANWMGYANLMMSRPFEAWKGLASFSRNRREAQERVTAAYRRWKTRQKLSNILKTWRHQAVYGSVEGMYSRTNLTKSLAEQKNLASAMQKLVSQQTMDLEKCRDMIKQEVGARGTLEKTLVMKDQEIIRLKIQENHFSQEIYRLHALIDAMTKINPRQIKLIKKLQEEFGFTARPITGHGPNLKEVDPQALLKEAEKEERAESPSANYKKGEANNGSINASFSGENEFEQRIMEGQDQIKTTIVHTLNISPEDESLLRRTKWLLGRFLMEKEEHAGDRLAQLLQASSLDSQESFQSDSSIGSDDESVLSNTNADGLADAGIFGGRRKHSLMLSYSGEMKIEPVSSPSKQVKPMSLLAAALKSEESSVDALSSALGAEMASELELTCPNCDHLFHAPHELIGKLISGLQTRAESLAASRQESKDQYDGKDNSDDAAPLLDSNTAAPAVHPVDVEVVSESNSLAEKSSKKHRHHHRHHKKKHQNRLKQLPLVPDGLSSIPMPLLDATFLQNTSRLMLAMSVFLQEGCSDYFNAEDRRHWASTLADCVADPRATLEPVEAAWGTGPIEEEVEGDDETSPAKPHSPLPGTGVWGLGEGGSDGTWREALLQLRTAYPAGLQTYGMRSEESGLYKRVADMRLHLQRTANEIERRTAHNFTKKHPAIQTLPDVANGDASRTKRDFRRHEHVDSLNIYSQTLPLQVSAVDPTGGREKRTMGILPDTSHLRENKNGDVSPIATTPKTPTRAKKVAQDFFTHLEGHPQDFNIDELSLSAASEDNLSSFRDAI